MSEKVLVIPFSDEVASVLDAYCVEQCENIDVNKMSDLITGFLQKEDYACLEEGVLSALKDNDITLGFEISVIIPIVAEYIVLMVIEREENEELKALYSLMLRNAMIAVVKGSAEVTNSKGIVSTYRNYESFLRKGIPLTEEDAKGLLTKVLNSESSDAPLSFETDESENVRALFQDAACYRQQELVGHIERNGETDIEKIYNMVDSIVWDSPWIYSEKTPAFTIEMLISRFGIAERDVTVNELIDALELDEEQDGEKEFDSTSILLNLIYGKDKDVYALKCDNVKLSIIEFAIYLYYEMLVEAIIKNLRDKEDE